MITRCICHDSDDPKSLLYPENRILHNLYVRLWNLTDERDDIFFESHPWLENPELEPKIVPVLRERQNEIEIEEVEKAIKFEEHLIRQKEEAAKSPPVQGILPIDSSTSGVL